MCLYPKLIHNPKYKKNKKNQGVIPKCIDGRILAVPIGCGKCIECSKKKSREWQVRLNEEIRNNKEKKYFITLTYSNENYTKLLKETGLKGYEADNKIATLSMRRYLERWRKKHKKSVRHWAVTEIGGGRYEHLHIHAIIITNKPKEDIEKIWQYGYVHYGDYVNEQTINYIVKYIGKQDEKHKTYKSIILCSSGIGKGYTERTDSKRNKYIKGETNEVYTTKKGIKLALPIYYRNKIYTEEEREKLWIEKLDKQIRYVGKEKIDISTKKGEEEYKKLRNWYRIKSEELGHGKPNKWKDVIYEHEKRILLQKERGKEEIKTEKKEEIPQRYIPKINEW